MWLRAQYGRPNLQSATRLRMRMQMREAENESEGRGRGGGVEVWHVKCTCNQLSVRICNNICWIAFFPRIIFPISIFPSSFLHQTSKNTNFECEAIQSLISAVQQHTKYQCTKCQNKSLSLVVLNFISRPMHNVMHIIYHGVDIVQGANTSCKRTEDYRKRDHSFRMSCRAISAAIVFYHSWRSDFSDGLLFTIRHATYYSHTSATLWIIFETISFENRKHYDASHNRYCTIVKTVAQPQYQLPGVWPF